MWRFQHRSSPMLRPFQAQRPFFYLGSIVRQDGGTNKGHSQQTEQSQEHLQESKHSLEVIIVQHQDWAKAVPKLQIVDSALRITVVADDQTWTRQAVILSYDKH